MAQVTVYSTPSCGYCKMEKEFLTSHDIAFTEIDVAADEAAAQKMVEKTGQIGVPQTVIEMEDGTEEIFIGFDEERLRALLKIEG